MKIDEIIQLLKKEDSPRSEFVKYMEDVHDPFLVLISCILSLRTKDETTYPATLRMLKLGRTPKDFASMDEEILSQAIYPVGFYRNKARQIIELSKELVEKYDSKVPSEID